MVVKRALDQEPKDGPASYVLPLRSQIFSSHLEFSPISKMKMDAGICCVLYWAANI